MASSVSSKGIAAIVGVGPKLSRSIARKFAHEGYTVAILARDLGGAIWSSLQQKLLVGKQEQQQSGVWAGEGLMDPDGLAQTYWHLHIQDRSAWTQEIDLHPSNQRYI